MEFDYYLNNSAMSGITVKAPAFYYNAASTSGNFGVNSSSNTSGITINDSSNDSNFTALLTFNKSGSNSQVLLSNYNSTGGYSLGLTDGNFLYIDSHSPSSQCFIFDKINLGLKNCLAIRKAGRNFSVLKYDLVSREFESKQNIEFGPNQTLIGGANTSLAAAYNGYTGLPGHSGKIGFFNGTVDQFFYLSGAVEDSYLYDLLSGFLPFTKTPSTTTSYALKDESYRFPDSLYSGTYQSFLSEYFANINLGIITNLGSGRWLGTGTGYVDSVEMYADVSFSTGLTPCYGTGVYYSQVFNDAGVDGYTEFTDSISVYRNSGGATISHNMRFLSGGGYYRVDYDASYNLDSSTTYSFAETSSYYTGFKMNGVVSDQVQLISLGSGMGVAPTGYNLEGFYDVSQGQFFIQNFNTGSVHYNGTRYNSGYTVSDYYIDITSVSESPSGYMIGDNHSGVSLLSSGINFATGNFYGGASQAYSGVLNSGRMRRRDYKETSSHHLYHAAKVQGLGSTLLYDL